MFTGIVTRYCPVQMVRDDGNSREIVVQTRFGDLIPGESISVNGVCLTVVTTTPSGEARFQISPETLERSNLRSLAQGSRVNLERALQPTDRLGGHFVQGHVDGTGLVENIEMVGEYHLVRCSLPESLNKYCVEKGSISLNGVSLTLNKVGAASLEVMIVPHTWDHTFFQDAKVGDTINIEVDILAKYVEKQVIHAKI